MSQDFVYFINFIKNNNIFSTAIAAILSEQISNILSTFFDGIVLPVIDKDCDGDGKGDIRSLENKFIIIGNIKFPIGQFLLALVKFLIITYILFIFAKMSKTILW